MIFTVLISERAENDLRDIFLYISSSLRARENAVGQLKRLEKAINALTEFPERFKIYESDKYSSGNLRVMPVDNYLVFYNVDNDRRIVNVVRVLYGARDIDKFI